MQYIYDLVYMCTVFYGALGFLRRKYVRFYISLFSLISSFWGYCGNGRIQIYDYLLLLTVFSIIIEYRRNKRIFNVKHDSVGKGVLFVVGYIIIANLISPFRDGGTFSDAIIMARFDLYYLIYFVFRSIPKHYLEEAFPRLIKYSCISCVAFFLQFVGISLVGSASENQGEYMRFGHIPILTIPILIYAYIQGRFRYKNFMYLILFGSVLLLSQNRGSILGVVAAILYYTITNYRSVSKPIIVSVIVMGLAFSSLLAYRFSDEGSTGAGFNEETKLVQSIFLNRKEYRKYDNTSIDKDGTFVFRSAMVMERMDYLSTNYVNLLFGLGSYHELSPQAKSLPFVLGAYKAGGIVQKVDTTDVAFLSHVFRYGLCFLFIYILFLVRAFARLKENKSYLAKVAFLVLLSYCVTSVSAELFFNVSSFPIILSILAYCYPEKMKYGLNNDKLLKLKV